GELAALRKREGREAPELSIDGLARDAVAVHSLAVICAELEGGEGRDRAGDADRGGGVERRERNRPRGGAELVAGGRVGVQKALGQSDRPDVEARALAVQDQLGRSTADVQHECLRVERAP